MEYLAPIGLALDIVGFILLFWKGSYFIPKIIYQTSSVTQEQINSMNEGDEIRIYEPYKSSYYAHNLHNKKSKNLISFLINLMKPSKYDKYIGLTGAILIIVGFTLQFIYSFTILS